MVEPAQPRYDKDKANNNVDNDKAILDADHVVDAVTRVLRRGEIEFGLKVNQIL